MKDFKNKVAVITGGASGIGRGIAERCVDEGMKVVLADVEQPALEKAQAEMQAKGADILAVQTDVSKADDIEELVKRTMDYFGGVHLLCNNAGVGGTSSIWESTLADWEWVMGVNLWGVIHGVRAFVPVMLEQDTECHIVNTASGAGLTSGMSIYCITKHAVVALSEALYHQLSEKESNVKVSVLCPAFVNTQILDSARNRPSRLQNDPALKKPEPDPETEERSRWIRQGVQEGMPPKVVADYVFEAVKGGKFYILTHPEVRDWARLRMDDVLEERNPTNYSTMQSENQRR